MSMAQRLSKAAHERCWRGCERSWLIVADSPDAAVQAKYFRQEDKIRQETCDDDNAEQANVVEQMRPSQLKSLLICVLHGLPDLESEQQVKQVDKQ